MKKLLSLLILLSVVFIYTGCSTGGGDSYDEPVIDIPGNWTVMVWLDGDNDLEKYAINDLNEMELGLYNALKRNSSIENNIKIIVQVDRCSDYLNGGYDGGSDWQDTRRYRIKPDSVTGDAVIRSEKLSELGEINMGDASELKDFISYCKINYPSDNYALILWNHGGGVKGTERSNFIDADYSNTPKAVCWDYTDSNDCLYIGEITDVLTGSEAVDFLGFDACLMGMAEIAYEYRPGNGSFNADYMTASPATEQGDGWEYDSLFYCFTGGAEDGLTAPAEYFSKAAVAEYKRAFSYYSAETMAAYDLTKISDVKDKLDALAVLISTEKDEVEDNIRGEAPSTYVMEYFGQTDEDEWISWPHFDLYDFASRVSSNSSLSSAARSAADALKSSVASCVLKSWGGSSYSGHTSGENGLGFFFTDGDYEDSSGNPLYSYQWWYTSLDTASSYGSNYKYGNLDFCNFDNDTNVETWKELLEAWYDSAGSNSDTF